MRFRVGIVGGGISGLVAAYRVGKLAQEQGLDAEVVVLEASPRAGGVIRTERSEGYLLEGGPDSLVGFKPAAVELCRELGLGDELVRIDPATPTIQIIHHGRPVALPEGFRVMAPTRVMPTLRSPLFSLAGKLRMLGELWVPPRPPAAGDESVRSFVERRLGREAFDRVAEPIVGGLFTANADRLSLAMTMGRFAALERSDGSILKGMRRMMAQTASAPPDARAMFSLTSGLWGLVERLLERLPADCVRTDHPVTRVDFDEATGCWKLEGGPASIDCDSLVLACPAFVAAEMIRGVDSKLADALGKLGYASCSTVNLAYRPKQIRRPLDSYGFFVPRTTGVPLLACSYVSEKYPQRAPRDRVLLRAFLGGALHPEVESWNEAELIESAHRTLAPLLRIEGRPVFERAHRFIRSMPQFDVDARAPLGLAEELASAHSGLAISGAMAGGLGVPDCVRLADAAARKTVDALVATDRIPIARSHA